MHPNCFTIILGPSQDLLSRYSVGWITLAQSVIFAVNAGKLKLVCCGAQERFASVQDRDASAVMRDIGDRCRL